MGAEHLRLTRDAVHVSHVDQLISDSFKAMILARIGDDESSRQREARSSILHAALAIEHLANNCLKSIGLSSRLFEAMEWMASIDKLEFFLWQLANGNQFERGCREAQCVADLISLRNAYVHPKIRALTEDYWPNLKIRKSSEVWGASEAEIVFRELVAFLNVYLLKWCQLTRAEIAWLLRSVMKTKEGFSFLLFRTNEREVMLEMADVLGQELTFLGVDKNMLEGASQTGSMTIDITDEELARIRELQDAAQ